MNTCLEVQSSMQDYAGALETATEIVQIYRSGLESEQQKNDPVLAKYLYALSSIHGKLGNEEKTIETFNESKAIVKNCSAKGDPLVGALQKMLDEVQPKITELEAKRRASEPK